jgi:hypothetical protein
MDMQEWLVQGYIILSGDNFIPQLVFSTRREPGIPGPRDRLALLRKETRMFAEG